MGKTRALPAWIFSRLVHVFDIQLVDQKIGLAGAVHFDAVAVIPFDPSMHFFTVLEHDHHRSAGLHLFLVIEALGVSLLRRRSFFTYSGTAIRALAVVATLVLSAIQRGTNQLTIDEFFLLRLARVRTARSVGFRKLRGT